MSANAGVAVLVPPGTRAGASRDAATAVQRPVVWLLAFAALGLYGALRWATLFSPAPHWRLFGLLGLSLALLAAGTVLDGRAPVALGALVVVATLLAFALAGVPVPWITHLRIAVTATGIGDGLSSLPRVLLPYLGAGAWIKVVMLLGAAVLLLMASAIAAHAPRRLGEGRRVAAAVPLVALAVIPMTLVRPQLPYLQGLILFLLLGAFMWADRIRHGDRLMAIALAALATAAGMVLAPALDRHTPWLDYQKLAGSLAPAHPESFDWTQQYGPLRWPRDGRAVLEVQASRPDYWKAENLDVFNSRAWTDASLQAPDPSYTIDPVNLRRWTQTLHVTIRAMKSNDIIAAGAAQEPSHVVGAISGFSNGTWADPAGLGPGDSYEVKAYDPEPSPAQLAAAGTNYPNVLLPGYVSLSVPQPSVVMAPTPAASAEPPAYQQVLFAPFHSRISAAYDPGTPQPAAALAHSPYARAFALAQRLARRAATPYAYVMSVKRFLSRGFVYDENPPASRYPLVTFLFTHKRGYCQQFAGAMALLLRMGGVPARVAVGFTTGSYSDTTHSWVVSDADAHAWVEAWFPRYGWVRFDPTPAAAPARGGQVELVAIKGPAGNSSSGGSTAGLGGRDSAAHRSHRARSGGVPVGGILALTVLVALLALVARTTLRLREPTNDELLIELERALSRSGRRLQPGTTLAQLEQRFRGSEQAQAYLRALRASRFTPRPEVACLAQRRALRRELRSGLGVGGLLRSLWALPPRLHLRVPVWRPGAGGIHWT